MLFTKSDDEKLKRVVEELGNDNWDEVAKRVVPFSPRQCKDRYEVYLKGTFFKSPWTAEDDKLLDKKFNEIGPRWMEMVKFFNGRNANNIKNRYYRYHNKTTRVNRIKKDRITSTSDKNTTKDVPPKDNIFPVFEDITFTADNSESNGINNDSLTKLYENCNLGNEDFISLF